MKLKVNSIKKELSEHIKNNVYLNPEIIKDWKYVKINNHVFFSQKR